MLSEKVIEKFVRVLGSTYEDQILTYSLAAFRAGEAIKNKSISKNGRVGDIDVGHHATHVEADNKAQEIVYAAINELLPDAKLIGEEEDKARFAKFAPKLLTEKNYAQGIRDGVVVITDPLDGTASWIEDTGEWSVSVGGFEKGKPSGGAVYAPAYNWKESGNGILIISAPDIGAHFADMNRFSIAKPKETRDRKKSFMLYGCDIFLWPPEFLPEYTNKSWTSYVSPSCALGLARVATGAVDCLVQPKQRVWDWAAGAQMVENAGGTIIFYKQKDEIVEEKYRRFGSMDVVGSLKNIKPEDFSPERKVLGFVAARDKALAEAVMSELQSSYERARTTQETFAKQKLGLPYKI